MRKTALLAPKSVGDKSVYRCSVLATVLGGNSNGPKKPLSP